jgi:hypothetical protein
MEEIPFAKSQEFVNIFNIASVQLDWLKANIANDKCHSIRRSGECFAWTASPKVYDINPAPFVGADSCTKSFFGVSIYAAISASIALFALIF